jgi:hypothetical protein
VRVFSCSEKQGNSRREFGRAIATRLLFQKRARLMCKQDKPQETGFSCMLRLSKTVRTTPSATTRERKQNILVALRSSKACPKRKSPAMPGSSLVDRFAISSLCEFCDLMHET